jgi:hypothetical protein
LRGSCDSRTTARRIRSRRAWRVCLFVDRP